MPASGQSDISPLDMPPEAFRTLGHRIVDLMSEWLTGESANPVLEPCNGEALAQWLGGPLPREAGDVETVLEEFRERIAHYSRRNGHPRYFAYVSASADPVGILADALASALNQNVTTWRSAPAAATVERQVLRWLDEWVGFNAGGQGLLLGGGSAANLHAIGAAMQAALDRREGNVREELTLYVSREGHLSMTKAARFLGFAPEHVRRIAVDAERRMDPGALDTAIREDLDRGLTPAAVCASAGTANAGTIDPLAAIADVCERHDVWLHVDGAYGAPAATTSRYAWLKPQFARADSLSLDPHKWLYAPLDVGCLLVRDSARLRAAYAQTSEYIAVQETGDIEGHAFFDHGLELSRRFRALKLWFMFKIHGTDRIAEAIADNIETRQYFDARVAEHADLELLGSDLSISCFRFAARGLNPEQTNTLNRRILDALLADGGTVLSPTVLEGRFCLRICIVNFRTRKEDMDWLITEVRRLGGELASA
ncbi:MAG: aminotransferase class V-fold PLP-dependent enzyme [Gammaproteobacteria bacterium]|jgi:glutamate/tyrosine decarboxylase-like PLP-dependent enzyme